jgi:hypothetical protein
MVYGPADVASVAAIVEDFASRATAMERVDDSAARPPVARRGPLPRSFEDPT